MELSYATIAMTKEPLKVLIQERFPIRVSFGLAKVAKALEEHIKMVDTLRDQLIKKHGAPMENNSTLFAINERIKKTDDKGVVETDRGGKPIMTDNPNYPLFLAEIKELMDEKVEVKVVAVKIPEKVASTCSKCHHNMDREIEIAPAVLLALEKFVTI